MENVRVHKLNHARRGEGVGWGTLLKASKLTKEMGFGSPQVGNISRCLKWTRHILKFPGMYI